jgi:transposase
LLAVSHPPTCNRCGRQRPDDPRTALTWVSERDRRGQTWLCPECARAHVRDIESKLDQDWW